MTTQTNQVWLELLETAKLIERYLPKCNAPDHQPCGLCWVDRFRAAIEKAEVAP